MVHLDLGDLAGGLDDYGHFSRAVRVGREVQDDLELAGGRHLGSPADGELAFVLVAVVHVTRAHTARIDETARNPLAGLLRVGVV